MQLQNFYAQDVNGNIVPGAECTLFIGGTSTLATGLEDVDGNPLTNPFNANDIGLASVSAPQGIYDLQIARGFINNKIRIQFIDAAQVASDATAAAVSAASAAASASSTVVLVSRFLAANAADPTTRDNGSPLQPGDTYFNTTISRQKVYSGSAWISQVSSLELSASTGSGLVGFARDNLALFVSGTVSKMLSVTTRSIWEFSDLVTDRPSALDPNSWDWTPAFVSACAAGGEFVINGPQTYIVSTAPILNSTAFRCQPGVVFKRKTGTDGSGSSYWIAGAAMFELAVGGLFFSVNGQFTYDGNQVNQTATEPTGFFVKTSPPASIVGTPTVVSLDNGTFINGTSGYLLFRGDDVQRRYETLAFVKDCNFNATRYGKGPGDPSTPTPLGYSPNYVLAMDYVRLCTHNFRGVWDAPISTGNYAAVAVLGTFYGSSFANSGQCIISMSGHTYIRGVGRGGPGYDGLWTTTMNGIGAIDVYGNGESLFIEDIKAEHTLSIPIRAKCSLKNYTVEKAYFVNCIGGMNVSPSSTGPAACTVKVGQVRAEGCTIPVLEFTGTDSTTNRITSVNVDSFVATGTLPQENPTPAAILGPLRIRNTIKAKVGYASITGSNEYGVSAIDVENLDLQSIRTRAITGVIGLHIQDCKDISIFGYDIDTVAGPAITVSGATGKVTIRSGRSNATDGYGVFINSSAAINLLIDDCYVSNVTGVSRAYYSAVADTKMTNNISGAGVTNPVIITGTVRLVAQDNSWQPSIFFGGATAPASGPYRRGDVSKNQFPTGVAGSPKEFTCTVAGTPGTWVVTNF